MYQESQSSIQKMQLKLPLLFIDIDVYISLNCATLSLGIEIGPKKSHFKANLLLPKSCLEAKMCVQFLALVEKACFEKVWQEKKWLKGNTSLDLASNSN